MRPAAARTAQGAAAGPPAATPPPLQQPKSEALHARRAAQDSTAQKNTTRAPHLDRAVDGGRAGGQQRHVAVVARVPRNLGAVVPRLLLGRDLQAEERAARTGGWWAGAGGSPESAGATALRRRPRRLLASQRAAATVPATWLPMAAPQGQRLCRRCSRKSRGCSGRHRGVSGGGAAAASSWAPRAVGRRRTLMKSTRLASSSCWRLGGPPAAPNWGERSILLLCPSSLLWECGV